MALSTNGLICPIKRRIIIEPSTDNALARWEGKNGQLSNSLVTLSDEGKLHYLSSYSDIITVVSDSGEAIIDLNESDHFKCSLSEVTNFTISNANIGQEFWLLLELNNFSYTFADDIDHDETVIFDSSRTWVLYRFICTALDYYNVPSFIGWIEASDPLRSIFTANDSATVTFNFTKSLKQEVTLGANRILAVTGLEEGEIFAIKIIQGSGGGKTVTWWSDIFWPGGVAPTLSTAEGSWDWFCFIKTSDGYDNLGIAQGLQ